MPMRKYSMQMKMALIMYAILVDTSELHTSQVAEEDREKRTHMNKPKKPS